MNDETFMRLAIKEAELSQEPFRCATVIVKNGQVIAKAYNSQRQDTNASAHAEIKVIGEAGKRLGDKNLRGCIAYCTWEPCIMCIAALCFAKVDKLVYGVGLNDVTPATIQITTKDIIAKSTHKITIVGGVLENECRKVATV